METCDGTFASIVDVSECTVPLSAFTS